MQILRAFSQSPHQERVSYAHVVAVEYADHAEVFVSNCTPLDYSEGAIADDAIAQARQCFANLEAGLNEVGADLTDVVRVRYYLASVETFAAIAPVLREKFASAPPAATALKCALLDPRMLVAIEADARVAR